MIADTPRRRAAAMAWAAIIALMVSSSWGEKTSSPPEYVKRDTFAETLLALREPYMAWWKTLDEGEQARLRKNWWNDPAYDYRKGFEQDFPTEWQGIVGGQNYKKTLHLVYDWFRGEDDPAAWTTFLSDYMETLEAHGLLDEEAQSPLRGALEEAGHSDETDSPRFELIEFSNAACWIWAKRSGERLAFVQRLSSELDAALQEDSALRQEVRKSRLLSRSDSVLAEVHQLADRILREIEEGSETVITAGEEMLAEIAALENEALRYQIRSKGVDEIIFATRTPVSGYYHWYESFGYSCDKPDEYNLQGGGRLVILDLRTGETRDVFADLGGGVRDPVLSYDGKTVLFSYRPADTLYYHLYEIGIDGSDLRQLTTGKYDDIEPVYLPDGDIMFSSSRARRWVPCLNAPVANLYRCGPDGSGIEAISANVETENTPWVMPDGRILFMRWEYVERDRAVPHGLWTINPDGTGQMTFWGNMNEPDVFIDAKPIPGTDRVVYAYHPHGSADHTGSIATLTPNNGPDEHASIKRLTPYMSLNKPGYRDPFPVAEGVYLVTQDRNLLVYDDEGNFAKLYELPLEKVDVDGSTREVHLHEPRAVQGREREPVIQSRVVKSETTGKMLLADVTMGRNMEGVEKGDIKHLLVLEVLPKPVHHNGHTETISWNGSFFIERVLGVVPVEEDGSAYFEVPAMRCLFFVALDENGDGVKRMQSFVSVRPGETASCVGCHENRVEVAPTNTFLEALSRPAQSIRKLEGIPEIYHYPRDIQPILDKHCVECHDNDTREGDVVLNGDLDPWFNQSYVTLKARRQYAAGYGGVGWSGNAAPYTQGAGASPLMAKVDPALCGGETHQGVELSKGEIDRLRYWIESWAQYSGTYASLNNDPDWRMDCVPKDVTKRRCVSCHTDDFRRWKHHGPSRADVRESMGLRVNLSHPEMSLMLRAPLAEDAGGLGICRQREATGYREVDENRELVRNWELDETPPASVYADTSDPDYIITLKAIQEAAAKEVPGRLELPGFVPNEHWVREMKKHETLPAEFAADGSKGIGYYFNVDEAYYQMFRPTGEE